MNGEFRSSAAAEYHETATDYNSAQFAYELVVCLPAGASLQSLLRTCPEKIAECRIAPKATTTWLYAESSACATSQRAWPWHHSRS